MKKHSLITIANELNSIMNLEKLSTIEDTQDTQAQQVLTCLKLTCEEVAHVFDWIEQLRRFTTIIDHRFGWSEIYQGYNLSEWTTDYFDRFTSTYMYDMTNKKVIPEIKSDDKIRQEMNTGDYMYQYMRSGDYLIFQPDLPDGLKIAFYYQINAIAYMGEGDEVSYQDVLDTDTQKLVLDEKLVLRGAAARYRIISGMDNQREDAIFGKYLEYIQGSHSPAGVLQTYNQGQGYANAIDILGLPIF